MSTHKVAVVGSNHAAMLTALTLYKKGDREIDLDIYYEEDDDQPPFVETVSYETSKEIHHSLQFDWHNNQIEATPKLGTIYRDWGVANREIFCGTPAGTVSMNYRSRSLFDRIKESNIIPMHQKNFINIEDEIDADYIIDCRSHTLLCRDDSKYDSYKSPVNRIIIGDKEETTEANYVEISAIEDGWYSKIPGKKSTTYVFAFNDRFLSEPDALKKFTELFGLDRVCSINVDNYIAKSIWASERTFLNGPALSSYDPLDGSMNDFYMRVANQFWDYVSMPHDEENAKDLVSNYVKDEMRQVVNYNLWHYKKGSQFDTPFWQNAVKIAGDHEIDLGLKFLIEASNITSYKSLSNLSPQHYFQWDLLDLKNWNESN